MKRWSMIVVIIVVFCGSSVAQQTNYITSVPQEAQIKATTEIPAQEDDSVVRISTSLIQLDVVVTNSKGQVVTDLQPEDFEVLEAGVPQTITNFSFVPVTTLINAKTPSPGTTPAANLPPVRLNAAKLKRTIALLVDTLGASYEDIIRLKLSLKRFINEQMQPGDLVAVLRTGTDAGSVQQFTSDKRLLLASIDKLHPYLSPIGNTLAVASSTKDIENSTKEKGFQVGALGAVNAMVQGLHDLPGRKSIIIFSDGITSFDAAARQAGPGSPIIAGIQRLADQANRSAVAIYTVDIKGLSTDSSLAPSDINDSLPEAPILDPHSPAQISSLNVSRYLAEATGGFAIQNSNDLNLALNRIIADLEGYYVLAYAPDEQTFNKKNKDKFLGLTIRLKRPGLRVRTRQGIYREIDQPKKAPKTVIEEMSVALVSPFSASKLLLQMTAFFVQEKQPIIRSLIHIDGNSLTLTSNGKDGYTGQIDIIASIFGDNGIVIDKLLKTQMFTFTEKVYQKILKDGLVTNINFPIKKTGAYQFRVVVRDTNSKNLGSIGQFIEVPAVKQNSIAISGLMLGNTAISSAGLEQEPIATGLPVNMVTKETDIELNSVLKRFTPGAALKYNYQLYCPAGQLANLEAKITVFQAGKALFSTNPSALTTTTGKIAGHYNVTGTITLDSKLVAGEYDLQLLITDKQNSKLLLTQYIDFEVIP